ncbi:MAG: iron-sulfur cluster assembly accessory protein [Verrucomicrobia bacterium]|nr:iron-sulfur cluster assembly accessory protein [Verrucomicrobiota bacterium]
MPSITPQAAKHVRELLQEKQAPQGHGLRLSIEQGGCAGLQYAMNLAAQQTGDTVIESEGASIFIDAKSLEQLSDCTIDYEDGLTGRGFRIINPHAVRSCGCGTSFEAKKAED